MCSSTAATTTSRGESSRTTRSPSYGYFFKEGATTIPEWWDPWPGEHEVTEFWKNYDGDRAMNDVSCSLNHPALCSVFEGIFHHVWGLRQAPHSSGFEEIIIQPQFTDKLDRASGTFRSVRGPISLAWQRIDDSVRFDIAIPEGCRARLLPPDAAPVDLPTGRSSWQRGGFC
jgi:hypothetical protein